MMLIFTKKGRRPEWTSMSAFPLQYLFICIQIFVKMASSQGAEGPCVFDEKDLTAVCPPCLSDQWIELVGKGEKDEKIASENQSCFNNDPITLYYGDPSRIGVGDITVTVSQGEYHTAKGQGVNSLLLQKTGFFRYAYTLPTGGGGGRKKRQTPEASGGPDVYLDLDNTTKYYTREYKGTTISSNFQLIEWAGKSSETQRQVREDASRANLLERCDSDRDFKDAKPCKSPKHYMLNFQRDNGKIQFYPCNAQEGSNIAAMGAITKVDKGKLKLEVESPKKIWLAHGRKNIFNHYIDPMFLPEEILRKMAKTEGGRCKAEGDYMELRTVMDFAFTKHRLILGMKCGIVIVKGMDTEKLEYHVADLIDETGQKPNTFPDPVNKISASTCCYMEKCSNDLVAAYSFDPERKPEDNKFIYVSFNLGHVFEKKIVASPHSAVNLIVGMYKFYKKWSHYYEILHNPDDDDLKEDDEVMMHLREKPIWDMVLTDEKERLFAVGVAKEKKRTIMMKITSIVEERVPKRKERYEKKGVDIDKDRSPKWVRITQAKRRKGHGWKQNWTDESCEEIPECLTKFEDDKAVEWLLQSPDYNVKTPKRNDDEPFCKEITSILVLPEERHIMALCSIGYGKNKVGKRRGAGSRRRSGELSENGSDGKVIHSTEATVSEDEAEGKSGGRSRRSPDGGKEDDIGGDEGSGSGDGGDDDDDGGGGGGDGGSDDLQYFALFNFAVKKNLPLIHGNRVSQRIIACKPIKNTMNPDEPVIIWPELIRIPGSSTILIINCDGVIFSSTNFGNTLYNAAFYYEKDSVAKYCKQDPNHKDLTVEGCRHKKAHEHPNYIRSYFLCALDVPPLIIADRSASVLLMTFGRFYARGAIAYNRETRFVVGETMRDVAFDRRFENYVFPAVNTIGDEVLGAFLKHVYSVPPTVFVEELFKDRPNMRLVQLPFHNVIKNFQDENLAMCSEAVETGLGFSECKTISFSVHPHRVTMDINEKEEVVVRVKDDNPDLPLWIFSSNENSVEVKARNAANKTDELNSHNWVVEIKTKPNNKSEEESLVDSFFGSDYNKLNDYSTQVALVNTPTARCHVQPSSTVNVEIGCEGKKLVAHEDRHRPQCLKFRQDFTYTIKKGEYDPKRADFWIHKAGHEKNPFVKLLPNGDLGITYDYSSWGCPLEPFRADDFIPDLRILTEKNQNSTLAERFEGKFILIELFGAHGFSYTKTVGDVSGKLGCKRAPQTLEKQLDDWSLRQRLFYLAANRLTFPNSTDDFDNLDLKTNITGNNMFHNQAVWQQINIWNRANFLSCDEKYADEDQGEDKDGGDDGDQEDIIINDKQYEIMVTRKFEEGDEEEEAEFENLDASKFNEEEELDEVEEESSLNKINWNKKDHQRIYLFLAVAVDEYDSLCNYQTVFAVSLKKRGEMDDLTSILLFLLFVLCWAVAIVGGYFVRKKMLRYTLMRQGKADKLEQAAWLIVYRYEKLIHAKSMGNLFMSSLQFDDNEGDAHGHHDQTGMSAVAKSAYDKRKAELRMKKTHILAQEQARHEKLQKTFQKQ